MEGGAGEVGLEFLERTSSSLSTPSVFTIFMGCTGATFPSFLIGLLFPIKFCETSDTYSVKLF